MIWSFPLKFWLAPILYRNPVPGLQPERLYAYLDTLWQRRDLDGDIVEIGCFRGGTSAIAFKMLERTGYSKRYLCIDTFAGFLADQFSNDRAHGLDEKYEPYFSDNSIQLVAKLLRHYGCDRIELRQGDIVAMDEGDLPERVAVCLLDVDLEIPVYVGLKKVFPRLVEGGIIMVDDCPENYSWVGARIGYQRFIKEQNLPEEYFMGMGLVKQ